MKKCWDCMFFVGPEYGSGKCRRHAPISKLVIVIDPYVPGHAMWPRVDYDDSCGDFEEKIRGDDKCTS